MENMAKIEIVDREPEARKRHMDQVTAAVKQGVITQDVDKGALCLTDPTCPGFEFHIWRKRCKHCSRPREEHDIDFMPGMIRVIKRGPEPEPEPEPVPEPKKVRSDADKQRLAHSSPSHDPDVDLDGLLDGDANGLPSSSGLSGLDNDMYGHRPRKERSLEQKLKLAHQDPAHDHDVDLCSALEDEAAVRRFNRLDNQRNEMYGVGVPQPMVCESACCRRCDKSLSKGDQVIEVPNIEKPYCAPGCFSCANCGDELCEFNYYEYEGDVYCGRCHAEFFMPRCAGCDELIFDPTYTIAEGQKWHLVHFCCNVCDEDLCEKQYAKDTDEDDAPICLPCYNEKLADMCGTCKKPITAGERAMKAGDTSYHHSPECFCCSECTEPLDGKKCVQDDEGQLFCSPCYKDVRTPPCGRCGDRIKGEYVEVAGTHYMKGCYNCFECGAAFTREDKKGAYPVGDQLLCHTHALAALRAKKAQQAVAKGATAVTSSSHQHTAPALAPTTSAVPAPAPVPAPALPPRPSATAGAGGCCDDHHCHSHGHGESDTCADGGSNSPEYRPIYETTDISVAAPSSATPPPASAQQRGQRPSNSVSPTSPAAAPKLAVPKRRGFELTARPSTKGFVRRGTRQVSALPKRSRSVRPQLSAADKAAHAKAVADAEAAFSSSTDETTSTGSTSDGEDDGGDEDVEYTSEPSEQQQQQQQPDQPVTKLAPVPPKKLLLPTAAEDVATDATGADAAPTAGSTMARRATPLRKAASTAPAQQLPRPKLLPMPEEEEVAEQQQQQQQQARDEGLETTVTQAYQHTRNKPSLSNAKAAEGAGRDPFDALWAGFSIPLKFSKFKLMVPGREVLEIGEFMLIEKKRSPAKVFLVLCTDVALICKMVDEDCYELMCMPVERSKVKAKLVKSAAMQAPMKVKLGKWFTLNLADEVERSQWIGKLNAPVGFIPTQYLGSTIKKAASG